MEKGTNTLELVLFCKDVENLKPLRLSGTGNGIVYHSLYHCIVQSDILFSKYWQLKRMRDKDYILSGYLETLNIIRSYHYSLSVGCY